MSLDVVTLTLAKAFSKQYTDSAIAGISGGVHYKGAVSYYSDLPNNAEVGDAYTVKYKGSSGTETDGTEYVWASYEGTNQWIAFGPDMSQFSKVEANPTLSGSESTLIGIEVDGVKYKTPTVTIDSALSNVSENPVQNKVIDLALSSKQSTIDSSHKLSSDLVDDTSSVNKFVTASEKTTWDGKSTVSVSDTGTATDEISYITIDGTEKKIAGGGSTVANVAFEQMYQVTTDITNGTSTGDTLVSLHCDATVTITPDADYQLPTTISVIGCDYTYNNVTGVVTLSQATDDVTVTATCVAST